MAPSSKANDLQSNSLEAREERTILALLIAMFPDRAAQSTE
jgi:hypothetical protein